MDSNSGKRVAGRQMEPTKEKGVACKDTANKRKPNDRIGTIKPCQNTNHGILVESRYSRPCFGSSSVSRIVRPSSRNNSVTVCSKKMDFDPKNTLASRFDTSTSSSRPSKPLCSPCKNPTVYQSKLAIKDSDKVRMTEVGSSSVSSRNKLKKNFQTKPGPHKQDYEHASSSLSVYKSSFLGPSDNCNMQKYGTRNLKFNSITSVLPHSCSSSGSTSVGKNVIKRRSPEGQCGLSRRGEKTANEILVDGCAFPSDNGLSISKARVHSCNIEDISDGSSAFRARRSVNDNCSKKISNKPAVVNCSPTMEPSINISQITDTEEPNSVSRCSSSSGSSSCNLSCGNDDAESVLMPFSINDSGLTLLRNFDALMRDNVDGIVEFLLALEMTGQDEGMLYEQLHALETSLYVDSLNLYDQHHELRLDIDNMSYEELLDLEERMGTVSTAVSEETLSRCLKRTIYQKTSLLKQENEGETKCSICQDDFVFGDDIRTLVECDHGYHAACINQWLRLKNWCPVCKASAAPSESSM